MPTNRRYRRKKRSRQLDHLPRGLEWELLYGVGMVLRFETIDEMKTAWRIHRRRIMADWIKANPGSRPFSWWLFEGIPKYGERKIANWHLSQVVPRTHGILHTNTIPPTQESEVTYLRRHGLLTADEKKSLNWT